MAETPTNNEPNDDSPQRRRLPIGFRHREPIAAAMADRDFWTEWGRPLGLELRGFTARRAAVYTDVQTGITIYTEGQFAFLDRLRSESLAAISRNGPERA